MVKVTSERLPDAQVTLTIEVEPEEMARATERAFQSVSARINVPGFRRGRAPRAMVERLIGGPEALHQEAVERAIPDAYERAVGESGISPIDQPRLSVESRDPLVFKATVSIAPTVTLGDYKAIRLARVPIEVGYEQINGTIERLRDGRTEWIEVARPSRAGDRVGVDLLGVLGAPALYDAAGQPVMTTEGREVFTDDKNVEIEIEAGGSAPLPGFHDQLIGISAENEKRFTLTVPDTWPTEAQRGQTVLFSVKVHAVKEPKVPPLDDEFAAAIGPYESLEALRTDIRMRLQEQLDHESSHRYEDSVIAEAVRISTVESPPAMVSREIERLVGDFERSLSRQRLTLDQYMQLAKKTIEEFREEVRPNAEQSVRSALVLREIGRAEEIEVGNDEIDAEVERIVAFVGDGKEARRTRQALSRGVERDAIQSNLRNRKVMAALLAIAQSAQGDDTAVESASAVAAESAGAAETTAATPPND
ncbi:MAG: trigger factor [Chloroflexota bacterium]|nr:MAG: trigger factor [Chloroflexota bacterium]